MNTITLCNRKQIPDAGETESNVIWRSFLILAVLFGLILIIITPPFQVPDEPAHFFRAYQISTLKLYAEMIDGSYGGRLPESLRATAVKMTTYIFFHPGKKGTYQEIFSLFGIPLKPGTKTPILFPNTSKYPPIAYAPQATGIFIGRMCNLSPVALLYLGRLFNLIFWIICIAFTLRITPSGKWLFFLIALMPMTIFQAASLSADTPTNALSFLLIAFFLSSSHQEYNSGKRWFILLYSLSVSLLLCKQVYFPLIFMYFIVPRNTFRSPRIYYLNTVIYLIICSSAVVLWSVMVNPVYFQVSSISSSETCNSLVSNFNSILKTFIVTTKTHYLNYVITYIGVLGGLDIHLPLTFTKFYCILLVLISLFRFKGDSTYQLSQRIMMITISVVNYFLIFGIILILTIRSRNMTIGSVFLVEGVQGRYFIPFSPLLFISLNYIKIRLEWSHRVVYTILLCVSCSTLVMTVYKIISRFYI